MKPAFPPFNLLVILPLYRELKDSLGVPILLWKIELRVLRTYRTICFLQLDMKSIRILLLFAFFSPKKIDVSLLLLVTGRNIQFTPELSLQEFYFLTWSSHFIKCCLLHNAC